MGGQDKTDALIQAAIWFGVGLLALIVAGVAVYLLRKYLFSSPEESADRNLLDLATLTEMRDRGTLTEAEYKALRARALADVLDRPSATERRR